MVEVLVEVLVDVLVEGIHRKEDMGIEFGDDVAVACQKVIVVLVRRARGSNSNIESDEIELERLKSLENRAQGSQVSLIINFEALGCETFVFIT
jgi:hypothetical protein